MWTVRGQNEAAHNAGFPDRPAAVYAARGLSTDAVRRAMAAVRAHGAVLQRFERVRSAARDVMGAASRSDLSLDQALAAMQSTYGGLSPDYAREAAALLDHSAGRLEIGIGQHGEPAGFRSRFRVAWPVCTATTSAARPRR